ncbi:MAG: hypothetical protein GY697_18120 [Desulfobacterales bacterium]|nr:hypothetical protein [Desulfobacterales bacterium]
MSDDGFEEALPVPPIEPPKKTKVKAGKGKGLGKGRSKASKASKSTADDDDGPGDSSDGEDDDDDDASGKKKKKFHLDRAHEDVFAEFLKAHTVLVNSKDSKYHKSGLRAGLWKEITTTIGKDALRFRCGRGAGGNGGRLDATEPLLHVEVREEEEVCGHHRRRPEVHPERQVPEGSPKHSRRGR